MLCLNRFLRRLIDKTVIEKDRNITIKFKYGVIRQIEFAFA